MDEKFLSSFQQNIEEKLGKESAAIIADDVANLFTKNKEATQALATARSRVEELSTLNQKLVASNGSLLKQIPMGEENDSSSPASPPPEPEEYNIKMYLNEDGTFRKG